MRLPALLLTEGGIVVEANEWMAPLAAEVRFGAGNRLILRDRAAQQMLTDALQTIDAAPGLGRCTFPLRDELGKASMVLHLIPIKRSAHDIFGQSFALLLMTPVSSERTPSLDLMRSLFDLTPAEARVAQGIGAGKTLEDLAAAGEVSINTVRNQLRRVLEKTGCARQAELAALLSSVAVGAGQ